MRQRGLLYPYEIVKMLTPAPDDARGEFPPGEFVEHDLDADGRLVPVDRPPGQNQANIIVGVIRNFTAKYPEGMTRVLLLGDPSKDLGALAEPECRRILAALDLATREACPAGVVHPLGRRQDLHGQRRREHGLDRPRPASADRTSPRRAAKSTWWSTASTSARSPTGTPKPPC